MQPSNTAYPIFLAKSGPPPDPEIFFILFFVPPHLYGMVQVLYQKNLEWPASPSHPACSSRPPPTTNPITQKKIKIFSAVIKQQT
jgi:hypothetical protein